MIFNEPIDHKVTIMIVDDTPENLDLLQSLLKEGGYSIVAFPRGSMAIRAAMNHPPDLILLDINMPDMDGYEVCRRLKKEQLLKDIPVLFISANDMAEDKVKGFQAGGVDYVTKPFQIEELKARIDTHLSLVGLQKKLEKYNRHLEQLVQEKIQIIEESHISTIMAMIKLTEYRDNETGQHIDRTRLLCRLVASKLQEMAVYTEVVTDVFVKTIYNAAALHDIGKIGIPDAILLKPGKLNDEEWLIMKQHPLIGAQTLDAVLEKYKLNDFIEMGREIALNHHEKWDGSGYPAGRYQDEIPLSARIMAIVDIYDALRSRRPYKMPFTHLASMEIMRNDALKQYDPLVFEAFLELEQTVIQIYPE